ncbi:hypothetical protein ASE04_18520 [Rhizobium sp. Root708]|uniref:hypothetical protein n=1 Tax=Rhizobium sp. Root708 TaxID=1736592 RepID=UPI000700E204|nr:hypothetical protein [Rhizobium sp. Root708]KRB49176.1 hypothetical protein ASE04_18520 [Rhizobium sp. Root708]
MASSPWKFLFGLGRRRDKDDPGAARSEPEIIQPSDAEKPAVPDAPPNIDEHSANDPAEPVAGRFTEPSDVPGDVTPTAEQPENGESAPSAGTPLRNELDHTPAQKHQSKTRASKSVSKTATLDAAPTVREPLQVGMTSAARGILELDDDIRELRRQLAERLRSQNAQLKTMLERFERD